MNESHVLQYQMRASAFCIVAAYGLTTVNYSSLYLSVISKKMKESTDKISTIHNSYDVINDDSKGFGRR